MKKIFSLVLLLSLVVALSSTSMAAKAKPITSGSNGMKLGLGVYGGYTTLRMIGDTYDAAVGAIFQSGSGTSTFGLLGLYTVNLTGGNTPTHVGGLLNYVSTGATNIFIVSMVYGAETMVTNNLLVGVDVTPVSFTSASGTSTFILGGGTVHASFLL